MGGACDPSRVHHGGGWITLSARSLAGINVMGRDHDTDKRCCRVGGFIDGEGYKDLLIECMYALR